jgi:hypothetical protein
MLHPKYSAHEIFQHHLQWKKCTLYSIKYGIWFWTLSKVWGFHKIWPKFWSLWVNNNERMKTRKICSSRGYILSLYPSPHFNNLQLIIYRNFCSSRHYSAENNENSQTCTVSNSCYKMLLTKVYKNSHRYLFNFFTFLMIIFSWVFSLEFGTGNKKFWSLTLNAKIKIWKC